MKITTLSNGNVRLQYWELRENDDGDLAAVRVSRDFFTRGSNYVYEWDDAGDAIQVCEALDGMGPTLMCKDPNRLGDVIRRHFRRFERACNASNRAGFDENDPRGWGDQEGDIVSERHPLARAAKGA